MDIKKEMQGIQSGYLVKYALTSGVEKIEFTTHNDGKYAKAQGEKWRWGGFFNMSRDVASNRESALLKVESMRQSRIASLKKQIAKLEGMKIEVPE